MIGSPLDPVGAAAHATMIQGGYSTPGIEAYRILGDALRRLRSAPFGARWAKGVRDTLAWLDANPDPIGARDEARRFTDRAPRDWRRQLEHAAAVAEAVGGNPT